MNEAGMIRWKLKDRVIAQDKEIEKLQAEVADLKALLKSAKVMLRGQGIEFDWEGE